MRTAVTLLSTTIASIIVAFGHKIVTGEFPPVQSIVVGFAVPAIFMLLIQDRIFVIEEDDDDDDDTGTPMKTARYAMEGAR